MVTAIGIRKTTINPDLNGKQGHAGEEELTDESLWFGASLDLSMMMRELSGVKHVTRDDGVEFGDVPALHQCRATSSHHMESKMLIVNFASSDVIGQSEAKSEAPRRKVEGKPSWARFGTQSRPIGPNLCSNDVTGDGDS